MRRWPTLNCMACVRLWSQGRQAELVYCGAVKVLCRAAGEPGGGRLASAAVTALSDMAHDSTAAVQVSLVRLVHL